MTLEHRAFLYGGIEHFLSVSVPYLTDGVAAGEAVIAVVREPGLGALRDVLAPYGDQIQFYDSDGFYEHPVRTLKSYQELVMSTRPRTLRALAEPVWEGWTPRETLEWARYESLINVAFADSGARALCPYDLNGLPDEIIDHARRTHPLLAAERRTVRNADYVEPAEFGGRCDGGLTFDRPPGADYQAVTSEDLRGLRAFVAERAIAYGVDAQKAQHLVTAVNEVAANAVRHGSPPVGVWVWPDGPELLCDIGDNGLWHADPLVGFVPPESALESGFGLWSVRLLVDLMELRAGWDGTFVRLHVRR
jgi:anti-sigma regulatory factor (Ser/Thr protein kinase)